MVLLQYTGGQWEVEPLQCTASLPGGSGQWHSCNALFHCLGAVDMEVRQCNASLPGDSGHCNSCNTLLLCLGAVGSGALVVHCLAAWG